MQIDLLLKNCCVPTPISHDSVLTYFELSCLLFWRLNLAANLITCEINLRAINSVILFTPGSIYV